MEKDVLRILCLHGYRQSAASFKQKTGALRKLIKKHVELIYISAPLDVPASDPNGIVEKGWWFSREDDNFLATEHTDCAKGFKDSLKVIENAIKDEGPFDGIMGFSQGAAMAALLCILQEEDKFCSTFKFAILISGFKSQSSLHAVYYLHKVTLPSLHVFGRNDQVIGKDMSEELLEIFPNAVVIRHDGGHYVPASKEERKSYIDFLSNMSNNA